MYRLWELFFFLYIYKGAPKDLFHVAGIWGQLCKQHSLRSFSTVNSNRVRLYKLDTTASLEIKILIRLKFQTYSK